MKSGGCRGCESGFWKRGREAIAWIIPGVTLALAPKCPLCVAAYVALFSGVSISAACASNLRVAMLALCAGVLVCLALKRLGRLASRNRPRSKIESDSEITM